MNRLCLVLACVAGWSGMSFADDKPVPVKLSDEEVTKLLLGTWENSSKLQGMTFHTKETFHKDGTFDRVDTNSGQPVSYKGKWELKKGVLSITPSDGPYKGIKVNGTITAIDDKTTKMEMEGGALITKTRVKE